MAVVPISTATPCAHRGPVIGDFPVRDGSGRLVMRCGICGVSLVWDGYTWAAGDDSATTTAITPALRPQARR